LINLGVLLRIQGRLTAARRQYEEALQLKRTLGDYTGEALALNNLGNIAAQMGDYPAARLYFQQALQIYESLGRQRDQGMAYSNLGLLTFLEGDYPGAVTQSRQAMAIAARLGDRTTLAYAATHAAHALAAMELWEPAAEAYQQAVDLREEMGETLLMLESQAGLARIAFARGNAAAALELAAPLIPHLQKGELGSSEQPFRLYLTCIQILRHHRDGRAADLLRTAAGLLLNQAAKITAVADRRRFLQEVSAHTQLLAWADEAGIDVMVDHPAE